MVKPMNLDQLQSKTYAVLDTGAATQEDDGFSRRRQLARRREWFNTDEQYLQYMLIIEALEIQFVSLSEDGDRRDIPFTWDLTSFGD